MSENGTAKKVKGTRVGTVESKADAQALAARLKREERLPTWVLSEGGS